MDVFTCGCDSRLFTWCSALLFDRCCTLGWDNRYTLMLSNWMEGNVLFTVIWHQTYGKRPLKKLEESCCRHMGYSFWLTARVLLYAPSHRQDNTYHGLCYSSCGVLAGTRNNSMVPVWLIDLTTYHTMSERFYHRTTSRFLSNKQKQSNTTFLVSN